MLLQVVVQRSKNGHSKMIEQLSDDLFINRARRLNNLKVLQLNLGHVESHNRIVHSDREVEEHLIELDVENFRTVYPQHSLDIARNTQRLILLAHVYVAKLGDIELPVACGVDTVLGAEARHVLLQLINRLLMRKPLVVDLDESVSQRVRSIV